MAFVADEEDLFSFLDEADTLAASSSATRGAEVPVLRAVETLAAVSPPLAPSRKRRSDSVATVAAKRSKTDEASEADAAAGDTTPDLGEPVADGDDADQPMETIQTPGSKVQSRAVSLNPNASAKSDPMRAPLQPATEHDKAINHEVAMPPDAGAPTPDMLNPQPPVEYARQYPFALDPFQQCSVSVLERNESVLVAAHTSAGKTVVAEYAIAMALRHGSRVIYTSPIKALSNQKYRDFADEFKDVGLMTGDVTIDPNASILVMTTEILRSMLYRGSEVLREVSWVIFDEVHYMRDKERGVVWEETIILLNDKVRFVFLSATIPNAFEFASWIASLHNQPCHVVYTEYRPTPLQHYVFPIGGDGIYLVVDEKGKFREDNFQKALSNLTGPNSAGPNGARRSRGAVTDIARIVQMIMDRHLDPVIVFAFSKKECEALATKQSKFDFNSSAEKDLVKVVFDNAVDGLSDEDKSLPQVEKIFPLLSRGIGIHHSGLLPILKETIEILFQEGLLKVLFATETFSIGLNMPAKTVVFTSVRKFDGAAFRPLTGGEYIQMSGRAGRRGKDDRGLVIMMIDEQLDPNTAKGFLKGHSDPLNSSFRLSYNMLLNLLRVEGIDPEYIMRRSFHQFQNQASLPALQQQEAQLIQEHDSIVVPDFDTVSAYHTLQQQWLRLRDTVLAVVNLPKYSLPYLQRGRILRIRVGELTYGWAAVLTFRTDFTDQTSVSGDDDPAHLDRIKLDVLLMTGTGISDGPMELPPPASGACDGEWGIHTVTMRAVDAITTLRMKVPGENSLLPRELRNAVGAALREVQKRYPEGLPLLDPVKDMRVNEDRLARPLRNLKLIEEQLAQTPLHTDAELRARVMPLFQRKLDLQAQVKSVQKSLRAGSSVVLKDELRAMRRVLRRLGFTNASDVIEIKGRVACEISTADELVLTEMIFDGAFNDLDVPTITALLSVVVFNERAKTEDVAIPEPVQVPYGQLLETARRIALVSQESRMHLDLDEYVAGFPPTLVAVTYAWARGASFAQICGMTDVFEGSVIRALRRLDEVIKQCSAAAKTIGNVDLEVKFAQCISAIKRDIVFAASLYL